MTDEEKLKMMRVIGNMSNETEYPDYFLSAFLNVAASAIIEKAYPFRDDVTEVPEKYDATQVKIAIYLANKQGAEGENYHSENGINRTYEAADVPPSMLRGVIPFVKVIS